MNDTPALNADGTLKDASEIEWFHSPSDAAPIAPTNLQQPPLLHLWCMLQYFTIPTLGMWTIVRFGYITLKQYTSSVLKSKI
jgi:hypothetical protein